MPSAKTLVIVKEHKISALKNSERIFFILIVLSLENCFDIYRTNILESVEEKNATLNH